MDVVETLDETGKAAWITVMIIGFVLFWPIGLGILCYLICTGRMGEWKYANYSFAHAGAGNGSGENGTRHKRHRRRNGRKRGCGPRRQRTSGNSAFDTYREEVLRRLEDEQTEFEDYLERLRQAKDKEEFETFMAERKDQATDLSGDVPEEPEDEAPKP